MTYGDQYDLFGGNPPAQRHSPTSLAAAEAIKGKIGPLHAKIKKFLTIHLDGATDEQMQELIPMSANTQRPRRVELVEMGYVVDSGRTRMNKSGALAAVWILAPPDAKPAEINPEAAPSSLESWADEHEPDYE